MVICPNCQTENRDEAKFCRVCGLALFLEVETPAASVPPADSTPPPPPADTEEPAVPVVEPPAPDESKLAEGVDAEAAPVEVPSPAVVPPAEDAGMDIPTEILPAATPATPVDNGGEDDNHADAEEPVSTAGGVDVAVVQEGSSRPVTAAADGCGGQSGPQPSNAELDQKLDQPAGASETSAPDVLALPVGTDEEAVPVQTHIGVGTVLNERYRILALVSGSDSEWIYDGEDLRACWNCAAPVALAEERFCESCGAELSKWPVVKVYEIVRTTEATLPDGDFEKNGWQYHIEAQAVPEAPKEKVSLRLVAGYQSDVGKLRDIDEDSVLVLQMVALCETKTNPSIHFFAVADGIGGNEAGEVASRIGLHKLAEALLKRIYAPVAGGDQLLPESMKTHLVEAILEANQAILNYRQQEKIDMGCTLTAALVMDNLAIVANVGDSRTYILRGGHLSQISRDHSVVAGLVQAGLITPEEVYTHEQRSVIYRSLGDKPDLQVDTFSQELEPGDRLILCCDGVWEMVRDPMIEDVLLQYLDPQIACNRLVEMANAAGGDDNISVIVVDVQALTPVR